jgi:hypothetical protein
MVEFETSHRETRAIWGYLPGEMSRSSAPTPPESELGLALATPIVSLIEAEAPLYSAECTRLEFLRMLLRRKAGLQPVERSPHAPRRKALPGTQKPTKERVPMTLDDRARDILWELCRRLGTGSKSTVLSHLVLDWVGVSPLAADFSFAPPKVATKKPAPRQTTGRRSGRKTADTTQVTLTLAAPVWALLVKEAERHALPSDVTILRAILSSRMGLGTFVRNPDLPPCPPLANTDHERIPFTLHMPLSLVAFIDEVSFRLGGGEKQSIVSHFVLEWAGISPLSPRFVLQSGRPS